MSTIAFFSDSRQRSGIEDNTEKNALSGIEPGSREWEYRIITITYGSEQTDLLILNYKKRVQKK